MDYSKNVKASEAADIAYAKWYSDLPNEKKAQMFQSGFEFVAKKVEYDLLQKNPFATNANVLLQSGADKISVNSAAVRNPQLINDLAENFGSQFVVVAIDAKLFEGEWKVHLNGGRIPTELNLLDWAKECERRGAGEILFTSMNNDGTKKGFENKMLAKMSDELSIPIIASGGAGSMEHFYDVFTEGKADAGLAASIFHFKEIDIIDLKKELKSKGIPVRI